MATTREPYIPFFMSPALLTLNTNTFSVSVDDTLGTGPRCACSCACWSHPWSRRSPRPTVNQEP
jgi:hypothetical protein